MFLILLFLSPDMDTSLSSVSCIGLGLWSLTPLSTLFTSHLHKQSVSINYDTLFKIGEYNWNMVNKSLKIPQGQSESVIRRRTDNAVVKRKRTNNNLQNSIHETKYPSTRTTPLNTRCELKCSGRVISSCFTVHIVRCGEKDLYQRFSWDRVTRTPQINYIEAPLTLTLNIEGGIAGDKRHFQQYFSYIGGRSDLLVEETGVHGENSPPIASHWQTLSHNIVSSTPRCERLSNSQL